MGNNKLPDDLLIGINEIKSVITESGRYRLLDVMNTLCGLAESRITISEEYDESKEAMTPLGGTIVEIQTVIVNVGQNENNKELGE